MVQPSAISTHRKEVIMTQHDETQTKTIALLGATGGTGRAVLTQALERGHHVRALVREGSTLEPRPGLTIVRGDATDHGALFRLTRGVDATVIALGAPAFSKAEIRSRNAAAIRDVLSPGSRVVCLSVYGAHETRNELTFFLRRIFFPFYLRRAVADHEAQETILEQSSLDVTLVRPPHLHDGPAEGAYVHGFESAEGIAWKVSRADLASFMVDEVEQGRYSGRAVAISDVKAGAPVPAVA
jgi:putative NADH-flavin reductase